MRRLVRISRGRLMAATVALVTLTTGAVTLYPGASGAAPQLASPAAEVSLRSSFQLLRSESNTSPPATVTGAASNAPSSFGLILSDARQSVATGAWLIPGENELCIVVQDSEGAGMSCAAASVAEQGGLAFVERSDTGGAGTVVGAAPDGMTQVTGYGADGSVVTSGAVQENTYTLSGQGLTGATPSS
jgi:hypothetical protein